ncbi:MAG: ATP-binding protein [Leptospirales bacterium]|nr:ATP-binding protein [Leptospirales bacterium]
MTKFPRIFNVFLTAIFLTAFTLSSSCTANAPENNTEAGAYASYRDIPGVTQKEIQAIEELQKTKKSFSYGMTLSTESFLDKTGKINGFSAFICDWLTNLFDIPFVPALYEWGGLVAGLESAVIDFTGEMTGTEGRLKRYYMTDAIVERQMVAVRMKGGETTSAPRYVFLAGTNSASLVADYGDRFVSLFVDDFYRAYEMLKSGKADAFVAEESARAAFDRYDDVDVGYFFPPIYASVSLATQNPELAAVISVVQKALEDGAIRHLVKLYNQGHQEYKKHKFFSFLDDKEREYIKNNPVVPTAAEVTNYPVSFYNNREGHWQGIAIDVLGELEKLTGIKFKIINGPDEEWPELLAALETGRAAMISELIYSEERSRKFIWPKNKLFADHYVLISKAEHHDISLNEILYINVGLIKGTAHVALFQQWFPNHRNTTVYEDNTTAIKALREGEIDMLMSSQHLLLSITNYLEQAGYKANFIFPITYESTFGFHRDSAVLCGIVGKALNLIDTDTISGRWMRKTFDYRIKLEQQRTMWLIGAAAVFFVIIFLSVLFLRKRSEGRRLENLVQNRTEALKEATTAAEAANRSKSTFLAGMSHEIRTPMNAIIGMLELLTHESLNSRQMSYVKDINHSATSLLSIINDILDMSKIESGKMELVPIDYDLLALLDNMHSMFTYVSEEKGLEFKFEIDSDVPHYLFGDDIRLRQIITNICGNAVKFTDKGYVRLKIVRTGDTLVFKISDTGRGIRQEDIANLFNPFQQVDLIKNRTIAGSGLGLVICKSFVDMMDGAIEVESEYGAGTTFTVTIPLIEGDSDKVRATAGLKGKKLFAPKAKILVVDDNEFNLRVAVGLLNLSKIEAATASSGLLALKMVQQIDYDIVFMDHMMPEMDGVETTAAIRALGGKFERLTIVSLTANAVQGSREFFLANGFNDFVSKPIDVRELISVLEKWLPENILEKAAETSDEHGSGESVFWDILNGIEAVNVKIGLSGVSGAENLYYESVELCCKLLPVECAKMSSFMADENIAGLVIPAHSMKSVLATIGAIDLADIAFRLEMAAKENDAAICKELFPDFHDSPLSLHKQLLAAFPEEKAPATKEPGDATVLQEGVKKALAAAQEYDSDAGIAAIEPLLAFDFGKDANLLLETVLKSFKEFDCEKAEDTLGKTIPF